MFTSNHNSLAARNGLSLIEIMIAMVMTLVILGAMMAAFSYGSAEMQKGRASIELNNRLVTAETLLRRDLDRITVDLKPYHALSTLPKGYVEIIDGALTDYIDANEAVDTSGVFRFTHEGNELVFGDRDDYIGFTIKSEGKAFRGRFGNTIVESHLAEVIWFTVFDASTPDPNDVLLVRRQLLILPDVTATGVVGVAADYDTFLQNNDISIRRESGSLVANNLTDLALRANRFSHSAPTLPDPHRSPTDTALELVPLGFRYNADHVMVSSVAAFDVQVYDPNAFARVLSNGDILESSDVGSQNLPVAERVHTQIRVLCLIPELRNTIVGL